MNVIKADGRTQPFQNEKIERILTRAAQDLPDVDVKGILLEVGVNVFEDITTKELQQLLINSVLQNVQEDPQYSQLAARVLLFDIYKQALGKDAFADIEKAHKEKFQTYILAAINQELIDAGVAERFNLKKLAEAIKPERDLLFRYNGLYTLVDRYLIKMLETQRILEPPQFFWMRVAMGVSSQEKDPDTHAIAFYEKMSKLEYLPSTPTLFNSATSYSQLSSCFLLDMEDSLNHIGETLVNVMQLAKYAGGIGGSVTKLRATGSIVKSINGKSSGPIPFIKMLDSVISGVSQGGRRRGTMAVYCEPWHYDIEKFLTLKQRVGDETQRVHALNTAVFLNDEFLKRVENDDSWYLFDPKEVNDLTELYGQEFSRKYQEYCEKAEKNQIRMYRKIKAGGLFRKILSNLVETSHPWLTFKDAANIRCPIKHVGTIHSSNLCTEVFLPTNHDQVAVCNLASINLARHLSPQNAVDWKKLEETVRLAIRQLDNVIDANYYAITEAENANKNTRPVGLGVMGLADMLEKMNIPYDSEEALELFDQIIEFISYYSIIASTDLAAERGSFPAFVDSDWFEGKVPFDTLNDLDEGRNGSVQTNRKMRLDWDKLRVRVQSGMRNGTVMAIAPTATISMIGGTTQSIEPTFSNVYSRNNLSGKFIEINENLVSRLKEAGVWEQVSESILLNRGELKSIQEIPEDLKKLFRTAYSISPDSLLEYAARAQKWIDMGCSRNMYFNSKSMETLEKTYLSAWKKGLKSTYYAYFQTSMHAEATYAYNESSPQSTGTVLLTKPETSCNVSSGNCTACE